MKPLAALAVVFATFVAAPAVGAREPDGAPGLPGVEAAGSSGVPRIRLSVTPRRVRVGRRIRFRFRARAPRNPAVAAPIQCRPAAGSASACARGAGSERPAPVRGALIRFAGMRVRTGPRGVAHIRVRLPRARTYRARVTAPGHRRGVARVSAVPRGRAPAFTG